ncbi:MAG: uracil-DNA glycosylase [Victivallales bacterium]
MKKDIFDQIIEHLNELRIESKTAYIPQETANEFFADIKPAPIPVKNRETAPAPAVKPTVQSSFPAPSFNSPLTQMNLDELNAEAQKCRKCPLCETRTTVVFGEGSPNADLMFIGEGPGYDEDQQGRPFVGKAGELLTKMINAMQFTRREVYIGNIVKCRPPKNRNPFPEEADACLPYLKRQIELIKPKAIVILGAVPLKFLLNKNGIMRLRGKWDSYDGIKVMPTFHPAYLLRNPGAKREVWEDLQQVMKIFGKVHKK